MRTEQHAPNPYPRLKQECLARQAAECVSTYLIVQEEPHEDKQSSKAFRECGGCHIRLELLEASIRECGRKHTQPSRFGSGL